MKKFIRTFLRESLLDEEAKRISSLPEATALFLNDENRTIDLNLYDPNTNNIYGTISITKEPNYYYVSGVAAERGFGPFMYELAMTYAGKNNMGLMPSRDGDVRGEAWNVWKQFYYNRPDVKKVTLNIGDEGYTFGILGFDNNNFDSYDEIIKHYNTLNKKNREALNVFNSLYYFKDNSLAELIKRGYLAIENGFDKSIALNAGEEFWLEMYN